MLWSYGYRYFVNQLRIFKGRTTESIVLCLDWSARRKGKPPVPEKHGRNADDCFHGRWIVVSSSTEAEALNVEMISGTSYLDCSLKPPRFTTSGDEISLPSCIVRLDRSMFSQKTSTFRQSISRNRNSWRCGNLWGSG